MSKLHSLFLCLLYYFEYLIGERKTGQKWPTFSGDQYFSPTNNFPRLKLTPTKNFYPLFFLLNKTQITEILKKHVLRSNFLERVLNFFYHTFDILNSLSNPCTFEIICCHLFVIFNSVVQIDNPLREFKGSLKRNFDICSCLSSSQLLWHFTGKPRIVFVRKKRISDLCLTVETY